jgi:hypothetical protein
MAVQFVYLDEFGHLGPFMARTGPKYNESPVFGLAGIILPEQSVRPFATRMLKLKEFIFTEEIQRSGLPSSHGKRKGPRFLLRNRWQNIHISEALDLGL